MSRSTRPRAALVLLTVVVAGILAATASTASGRTAAKGDAALARNSHRASLTREHFYFVMPDRFSNGDRSNDRGGLTGDREVTGFDPEHKGWYHGGDLKGLIAKLRYIKNLGTTAIWLTPSFKNKPVQGLGTKFPSAAYHGYWITDFERIDPHLGTNRDLRTLIRRAHRMKMKVFFDIITNHTADVIKYAEDKYDYIDKKTAPYKRADGTVFDDRLFTGTPRFPELSASVSFPYHPVLAESERTVKRPAWLNDVTLYHNRGNTTFSGENSTYGDFFGLDDLFTEHPRVVRGMERIYDKWIRFGVDGFRIDTMKHVNLEFWQQFLPHILRTARRAGTKRFFSFGEVAEENSNPFLSRFTTTGRGQAVLDFTFFRQARDFASSFPTENMATKFEQDDWFTDADSNAYQLPTFLGNHDAGHIGMFIRDGNPGAPESELLRRDTLAHELLYFSRGNPVVYFGDEQGFTGAGNDQAARQDMFPSRDKEYDNLPGDPPDPLSGNPTDDAGKNDNIGSDVTPAADNFDRTHPLYRRIARLARLSRANRALRDGAQQLRRSSDEAGILAFSRTNARRGIEYVVALNNAMEAKTARIETYSRRMRFKRIYGTGASAVRSNGARSLTVTVPALSTVVYRAQARMRRSAKAPRVKLAVDARVSGRPEVRAEVSGSSLYQVTFAVRRRGVKTWRSLGTDDNAPYRVFPDVSRYKNGTRLQLLVAVKDNAGHVRTARVTTTVTKPASGGGGVATIHYRRPGGDYAGWGLHLFGDAIAEGVGTKWEEPRPPDGFDAFGAFWRIPLGDPAASLSYIIHQPGGDTVPTTREPGGDRSFVPALYPEVWVNAGDPTIHTSQP